ncbi:nucleotide sugar dehydrogenase [Hansschlegelia plantiphila]|uniref:UDP-N-acetyl-D-galactosamine dehydrogenase n=1 Tax=Hansschlegelia plantiphila TaxID=374655 RepID=A0A9W6J5S0_9HYPH|nr:nucleotide sugar dehydrogenase [Hansschlegelia plantiphila]GLK69725.1 UDP-N-acetyl-D-galactosamine dehydrogenase [Hansschlegelia plantiphila]
MESVSRGRRRIAIIGLGYVGLPVAVLFARNGFETIGFDIDAARVSELSAGLDHTLEVEGDDLTSCGAAFTSDPTRLTEADFFIVTVPTPVDAANKPDLSALRAASRTVGGALRAGDIVVYESTVYPGATEEECVPLLEQISGLRCGEDFTVGYSPERINPGDKEHGVASILKVVSGQDERTTKIVADTYGAVITAGVHIAPSIKVAEAAKVIENSQRDINIAFMNELSEIFRRLDIDTGDVLAAAGTKWNFLNFIPGLVGGHCIGVDPYYLAYRAEKAGYYPQVILAGRRINDTMGQTVARECIRMMLRGAGKLGSVVQLGLTFKENVPDLRNSRAASIVSELQSFGVDPKIVDPWASREAALEEYGITLTDIEAVGRADVVILAVSHREFVEGGWKLLSSILEPGKSVVFDVKSVLDRTETPPGVTLRRL